MCHAGECKVVVYELCCDLGAGPSWSLVGVQEAEPK